MSFASDLDLHCPAAALSNLRVKMKDKPLIELSYLV